MMKTARTALAIAVLGVTAMFGSAQDSPGMGQGFGFHRPPMERALGAHAAMGRWWNNPDVIEKLKLTDDQRKAMDQILQDHRMKLIDLHANVEKAEVAMAPLIQADQPNESQILAAIDKVAQARAELEKANARFLLALRAKLSPDQWKQLQTLRSEKREERGPRHLESMPRHVRPGAPAPSPQAAPALQPPSGAGPQGMANDGPAQDDEPAAENGAAN